jgi:glycosyltransferase involved in cell wall biosynthesis
MGQVRGRGIVSAEPDPMNVGIDMTCLLEKPTGVDNYLTGLVCALGKIDYTNHYTLFVNREDRERVASLAPGRFRIVAAATRSRITRLCFQQAALPVMETVHQLDVIHSPSFIAPLVKRGARHVVTVHDMTFFSRPEVHTRLRSSAAFCWAVETSIRTCDAVAVPSEHTKADLLRLLPGVVDASRVVVTSAGIHARYRPADAQRMAVVRGRYGLPERFLLFVGTIEPRKNLARVLEAFGTMTTASHRPEHLVIVGKRGWEMSEVLGRIATSTFAERTHVLGFVPNEDLPAIYSAARVFVFPSLEEGFGFPPLEAMACGTAVVTSGSSSLAENVRDCAELVDPSDTNSIRAAMERLLDDEQLRQTRIRDGLNRVASFTWANAAVRMRECYERIVAAPRIRSGR